MKNEITVTTIVSFYQRLSFSIVFFGALVLLNNSHGQSFEFISFDLEPGIQGKGIVSVLQDSEGMLWVGTSTGLARYDGVSFNVFTHNEADSLSLTDNFLANAALKEDKEGNVWAGTRNGLSRWNRSSGSFTRFLVNEDSTDVSGNYISALHVTPSGVVWVGTLKGGVSKFDSDTDTFTHFRSDSSDTYTIQSDYITGIASDVMGTLWVSTTGGLSRFDESRNRFQRVLLEHDLDNDSIISTIHAGTDNYLWIGTRNNGLLRYDVFTQVEERIAPELMPPFISTIHQEASGTLWIGAQSDGVYTYDPSKKQEDRLTHLSSYIPSSLDDQVLDLHMDRSGVLWVASWSAGLRKGVRPLFNELKQSEYKGQVFDLPEVQTVFEDINGDIWGGLRQGGVIKISADKREVTNVSANPDVPLSTIKHGIFSILRDHEGYIWFATAGDGVYRYDEARQELVQFAHQIGDSSSISSNNIYSIYEDERNQLWFGTADAGINRFDRETQMFQVIKPIEDNPNSLSFDSVWPFLEDRRGRFWVGTFGGGLNLMLEDNASFKHYRATGALTALSNNRVVSILEASDGTFWIGTMGGGVNHFDPETEVFRHWSIDDLFPSVNVVCALEDDDQDLWLSTDAGLVRFNPDTEKAIVYNENHGISNATFSYGSCLKAKDGTMYFGTREGVLTFRPENIPEGAPPVTVVTALEAFDEPVPILKGADGRTAVMLEYNQNTIDIHYAALDFKAPGMNQFSFILDGYDDNWSKPSPQSFTRYTGLDPGEYTFRVRASDGYGTWAEKEATLALSIKPPFWLSSWFISAGIGVVLLIAMGFVKNRRDSKKEVELTKKRIASDLHDDLGSRMAALGLKLESTAMIKDPAEQERRIRLLAQRTRGIIQDLRDITRLVENGGQASLAELIITLRKQAHDLLPDQLTINGSFPNLSDDKYVTMLWKHNIILILSETLSNISMHAEATEVSIKVAIENEFFLLQVEDNGVGFDPSSYLPGKGIASLENRAKRLNGSLSLESTPGKGTCLKLKAPLKTRP